MPAARLKSTTHSRPVTGLMEDYSALLRPAGPQIAPQFWREDYLSKFSISSISVVLVAASLAVSKLILSVLTRATRC